MKIQIQVIPHDQQRYQTVGDWWWDDDGMLQLRVSQMSDDKFSFCVGLHELIESVLCKLHNIPQTAVDDFDHNYEQERAAGKHDDEDEPGDDPAAPYHAQHVTASICERAIAAALDIDWNRYAKEIAGL